MDNKKYKTITAFDAHRASKRMEAFYMAIYKASEDKVIGFATEKGLVSIMSDEKLESLLKQEREKTAREIIDDIDFWTHKEAPTFNAMEFLPIEEVKMAIFGKDLLDKIEKLKKKYLDN